MILLPRGDTSTDCLVFPRIAWLASRVSFYALLRSWYFWRSSYSVRCIHGNAYLHIVIQLLELHFRRHLDYLLLLVVSLDVLLQLLSIELLAHSLVHTVLSHQLVKQVLSGDGTRYTSTRHLI